jgi:NhaA family Na+:H+ antiporter
MRSSQPQNTGLVQRLIHSKTAGSIVLLGCTIVALAWANSPWSDSYQRLSHADLGISWNTHVFKMSLGQRAGLHRFFGQ